MQFVIIGRDGTDAEAPQRRQAARADHIQNTDDNMHHMIMGAATLDDQDNMNGSVMIVDFPSREALDEWLAAEPYISGKVWEDVKVIPCRVGPSFVK